MYDEVSEAEYARIVAQKRAEAGDFVVGDEALGYNDIGEDDWHRYEEAEDESDDEDMSESRQKKAKKIAASSEYPAQSWSYREPCSRHKPYPRSCNVLSAAACSGVLAPAVAPVMWAPLATFKRASVRPTVTRKSAQRSVSDVHCGGPALLLSQEHELTQG